MCNRNATNGAVVQAKGLTGCLTVSGWSSGAVDDMLLAALSVNLPDHTWLHTSEHRQAVHKRIPENLPVFFGGPRMGLGIRVELSWSVQHVRDWPALVAQERLKHLALQVVVTMMVILAEPARARDVWPSYVCMLQRKLEVVGDGQLFQRVQLRLQPLHAVSDLPKCLVLCGLLRSACKLLRSGR